MAVFTTLETTRLRLRHFTDADLALFMAYRNDPEVAKYQSWEGISEPEARAFIQEQKERQPGVPGQWFQIAIELKETGILVGDCALKIEEHDERQAEIGFTLSRPHQGRGIVSEAISCILEYAFMTLGLHRVIAITDCENAASIALLERLGLRREGHFRQNVWFKGRWADEYLYAILQEEWRNIRHTNRPNNLMSVEDYLTLIRNSKDARYEYLEGEIRMLAGGSPDHSIIIANLTATIKGPLKGGPCRVYNSDVQLKLSEKRYVCPDITVSCDERDRNQKETIRYPRLVVEVLSPSTEAIDRGKKAAYYRACPTIQEYVMVDSEDVFVEVHRREERIWTINTFERGDTITLDSLGIQFPIEDAYEGTSLTYEP